VAGLALALLALGISGCLRLEVTGDGSLAVEPPGADCSAAMPAAAEGWDSSCQGYPEPRGVTVTAVPDAGNEFLYWDTAPAHCAGLSVCEVETGWRLLLRAVFGPASPEYVPESVHVDEDGVLYLHSIEQDRIFRWSAAEERPLASVPLAADSRVVTYSPDHRALYVGYGDGRITRIRTAEPDLEEDFAALTSDVESLVAAGEFVVGAYDDTFTYPYFSDADPVEASPESDPETSSIIIIIIPGPGDAQSEYVSFDTLGAEVERRSVMGPNATAVWDPAGQRLYHLRDASPSRIAWADFDGATGQFGGASAGYRDVYDAVVPLCPSPDGSLLLLGSGDVFDAATSQRVLSLPGRFVDAVWTDDGVVTLREAADGGTWLELWGEDWRVADRRALRGAPHSVLPWDGGYWIVTLVAGRPAFHPYQPSDDADADGVPNDTDRFPLDPAASEDTDGDGHPDRWSPGQRERDSTSGLRRDFFPEDSACHSLFDGHLLYLGSFRFDWVCDVERQIPGYEPDEMVSDGSVVYLLSIEHARIDRWSAEEERYLNPILLGDEVEGIQALIHSPDLGRLYLAYTDGGIRQIDLGDPHRDEPFAAVPGQAMSLVAAGPWVVAASYVVPSYYQDTLYSFSADGEEAYERGSIHRADAHVWDPVRQRAYLRDMLNLYSVTVSAASGEIGPEVNETYVYGRPARCCFEDPLRLSPAGWQVFVAPHFVVQLGAEERVRHDVVPAALDALWRPDGLITLDADDLGDTRVAQRSLNDIVYREATLPGAPLRLLRWDGGILVASLVEERVRFHPFVPTDDADADGFANWEDDFPLDPAASVDTDGDGYPDAWNPGRDESDSTSGLVLDAFPDDDICWLAEHARPGLPDVCDVARVVPDYVPDDIVIDTSGVVYLLSPDTRSIYRWSMTEDYHLVPVPLEEYPLHLAYSAAAHRLYLGYGDGAIRKIELGAGLDEQDFAETTYSVTGLQTADPWVFAVDRSGYDDTYFTFTPEGLLKDSDDWNHGSPEFTWSAVTGRVYHFGGRSYPDELAYNALDPESGAIGATHTWPYSYDYPAATPIRISADGSRVVLGTGDLYDAADLTYLESLPGDFADAHWLGDGGLITLEATVEGDTYLVQWTADLELYGLGVFEGEPLRILEWDDRFLVIALLEGSPVFYEYVASNDADGDGVVNWEDAFPFDPAASLDSDGDGAPDAWNPGAGPEDSTDGLVLDAFPEDSACQLPEHAREGMPDRCDIARAVPPYFPDDVVMGTDDVLYLLSTVNDAVFRWSIAEDYHLSPIPVDYRPRHLAYSAENHTLYLGYWNGEVRSVALDSGPIERPFGALADRVTGLQTAGPWVFTVNPGGNRYTYQLFGPDGDRSDIQDNNYPSGEYTWSPANDRMYSFRNPYSPDDLLWKQIDVEAGSLGAREDSPYHGGVGTDPPIRVSRDGALVLLGSGELYDGLTLERVGELPQPIVDGLWTDTGLLTLRTGTEGQTLLEERGPDLRLYARVEYPGRPQRVLAWSGGFVVLTRLDGSPVVHLYESLDDVDGDGVPNADDAFPMDVAASTDSDLDGAPEFWNEGYGVGDSTTGLVIDAFPDAPFCWLPEHARAGMPDVCDLARGIPEYEPAAIVFDASDVVYALSPENQRIYRWSYAEGYHLEPIPIGEDARHLAYSAADARLYVGYETTITRIDLAGAAEEQAFLQVASRINGITVVRGTLIVAEAQNYYTDGLKSFTAGGAWISSAKGPGWGAGFEWSETLEGLFVWSGGSGYVCYHEVDAGGRLSAASSDYYVSHNGVVRVSPDGSTLVTGYGRRHDVESMLELEPFPSWMHDGAWGADSLITINSLEGVGTALERWDADDRVIDRVELAGDPQRIFVAPGGFAVVTLGEGRPVYGFYEPTDDSDADGVANDEDELPIDPAASVDSDGDGAPDAWNPGQGPEDSTTGLVLDAFPDDWSCQLPEHGLPDRPEVCDQAHGVPAYEPDQVIAGGDVIYLLSTDLGFVYRWSMLEDRDLAPIPVSYRPAHIAWSADNGRLYVGYWDGTLTQLDPGAARPSEQPFATLEGTLRGLATAGPWVFAVDNVAGTYAHHSLAPDGGHVSSPGNGRWSPAYAWSPVNRRMYHSASYPQGLQAEAIDPATGELGDTLSQPSRVSPGSPIRFSEDESRLIGSTGRIFDAQSLELLEQLPVQPFDAGWHGDQILTVRREGHPDSSLLEQWGPTREIFALEQFDDEPLALLPRSDGGFTLVRSSAAGPLFSNHYVTDDGDGDGVVNWEDDFPLDPAASVDSDGDGHPDAWNPGMGPEDSTQGLVLDAFPEDSYCHLPDHGLPDQPDVCDIGSGIPDYTPTRGVASADGVIHLLSPEQERIFRWSMQERLHLEPIEIGADAINLVYSRDNDRLYVSYRSGEITQIEPGGASVEMPFVSVPDIVSKLWAAGPLVLAVTHYDTYSYLSSGVEASRWSLDYGSVAHAWSPKRQRLFHFRDGISPNDLLYTSVDPTTGELLLLNDSPYHGDFSIAPPILLSPDQDRVLTGAGVVYDAQTLTAQEPVSPGEFEAGIWTPDALVTAATSSYSKTRVTQWTDDFDEVSSVEYWGSPLYVFSWDGAFTAVTQWNGPPEFQAFDQIDLDADDDGVPNAEDAFPSDPSASVDSDGDAAPDAWNAGQGPETSTDDLVIDAFPDDFACQLTEHGAGGVCDFSLVLPAPAEAPLCEDDGLRAIEGSGTLSVPRISGVVPLCSGWVLVGEGSRLTAFDMVTGRRSLSIELPVDVGRLVFDEEFKRVHATLPGIWAVASVDLVTLEVSVVELEVFPRELVVGNEGDVFVSFRRYPETHHRLLRLPGGAGPPEGDWAVEGDSYFRFNSVRDELLTVSSSSNLHRSAFDPATGFTELETALAGGTVRSVAISPDGETVAVGPYGADVQALDAADLSNLLGAWTESATAYAVSFDRSGALFASGRGNLGMKVFDGATRALVTELGTPACSLRSGSWTGFTRGSGLAFHAWTCSDRLSSASFAWTSVESPR
jgi:hypothetical protein